MNIALANYEAPPNCGGGGQLTADLIEQLRSRDHEVSLTALESELAGERSTTLEQLLYPVSSYGDLREAADDADVINCHFSVPCGPSSAVASWRTDTPLVVTVMGADLYDPTRYDHIRPALNQVNKAVFSAADHVTVPSTDMLERLPPIDTPASVIPHFADVCRYHPDCGRDSGDGWNLVTVARLVERKSLKTAVEALRFLEDDVSLTVVGKGPEREQLEAAAESADVRDRVSFRGYVPEDELPATMASHDIFVLPSLHEAFGVAVTEALASGLPVVSTRCGGPEDIVTEECGRLVERENPSALAAGARQVMMNYDSMAEAARSRAVNHYSAHAVVPQYTQLYQSLV